MIEPAAEEMLSPSRLEPYRRLGGTEQRAWELYLWNSELSTSYVQALGWLEIGLRNSLARRIHEWRVSSVPAAAWFDTSHPWFKPWFQDQAILKINEAVSHASHGGDVELHGKVVAELTFGFWSRLLARHYESSLWTHALRHAFPLGLSRGVVYERFDKLHKLRNRVAHYEPVLSMHHLTNWYRILETLDWLNSDYRAIVEDLCTLPEVASRQP